GNNTVTTSTTGGVYFTGKLSDGVSGPGSLILGGTTTVFLTNPAANNSFSGGTLLTGTITAVAGDSNALGSGTLAFGGAGTAVTLRATAPLTTNNPFVINASTTLNASSSANNITFTNNGVLTATAAVTLTAAHLGTTTFSGNLSEAGGADSISVAGLGTLAL